VICSHHVPNLKADKAFVAFQDNSAIAGETRSNAIKRGKQNAKAIKAKQQERDENALRSCFCLSSFA
jgi:hypothetical protein